MAHRKQLFAHHQQRGEIRVGRNADGRFAILGHQLAKRAITRLFATAQNGVEPGRHGAAAHHHAGAGKHRALGSIIGGKRHGGKGIPCQRQIGKTAQGRSGEQQGATCHGNLFEKDNPVRVSLPYDSGVKPAVCAVSPRAPALRQPDLAQAKAEHPPQSQ